jgi:hypothetical protein
MFGRQYQKKEKENQERWKVGGGTFSSTTVNPATAGERGSEISK